MNVICLHDEAFYVLVKEVVQKITESNKATEERWITGEDVMKKLHITSKRPCRNYVMKVI